ncbi:MAG: hypothetical protein B6U88_01410 [Candidatus Aenigmarchaeota archaeon ex4484_56]|nr:MAG: hypothetical protein B6U88_01410 [Candidatus Aenigmarchaeota archaeon ex4484_56]
MVEKPVVKIDNREIRSGIIDYLKNFGCNTEIKKLETADYLVSDRIGIERKTYSDFANSIKDLRLFTQLKELKNIFEKPIIIIEGFDCIGINPNSFFGAISSIIIDYDIPIVWTKNKRESANLIYLIAKREQIEEKRNIPTRIKTKPKNPKEEQEFLICGMPNINSTLSKRLLERFGTPKKIFNATEEELMEIKGFGRKKIKKFFEVLESEY